MSDHAHVATDDSFLSKLDRFLFKIEQLFALIGGIAVFMLMILAVFSVSGRNFFGQPLPGYVDWIEQAMPIIAFMSISYIMRGGGHIRMDMFVGLLKGRILFIVELITTIIILLLMILLVWGTWAHFERSFDFSAHLWSRDSSMDIGIPIWPGKLIVPVAFSVLSIRLFLQAISYINAIKTGIPIALPIMIDAEEQAKQEANKL